MVRPLSPSLPERAQPAILVRWGGWARWADHGMEISACTAGRDKIRIWDVVVGKFRVREVVWLICLISGWVRSMRTMGCDILAPCYSTRLLAWGANACRVYLKQHCHRQPNVYMS
jgi:hypothetical protein